VKNATEFAKKFKTFRKTLPAADGSANKSDAVSEVIYSSLLWNATPRQATTAFKKMIKSSVDLNELRVNVIAETIELIGVNYPQAFERSKRLRTVLNAIYLREHSMVLESLVGAGKRDIREYFETLSGITPFVCNRVIAMQYGVAAIPIDNRTHAALASNGIISEDADIEETTNWLGRQVKSDDVCDVHIQLHAWASSQPAPKTATKSSDGAKIVVKKETKKKAVSKKKVTKSAKKKTAFKKKVSKKTKKK
jgi:endonuclease III